MGLLDLFKEQLENETTAIAERRGLQQRGEYLIWWYFQRLLDLTDGEVEEIVTDNYADHGIDAIRIDSTNTVHFYSFKNPHRIGDAFPSGGVDSLLAGLQLVIQGKIDSSGANPALRLRVAEIKKIVPTAYRIHLITSGTGLNKDAKAKLDGFIEQLQAPSADFCSWNFEDIQSLQQEFYARTRPAVAQPFSVVLDGPPYVVRSAGHDCYMFSLSGTTLAELFAQHGEELLQQNIRVGQGDKATNALIKRTATSSDSGNFLHYNNGIVFLAEDASWDVFTKTMSIRQYQIVNGGQTIRTLHTAFAAGDLHSDVVVPVRVTTSGANKEFANNVAVNLNNQNRVENSFLRSNDPQVVQLAAALLSEGWYLERRENEVAILTPTEKTALTARLGAPVDERTIRLTSGIQAYVATFMREPELAKRYPKRIFISKIDGGRFEDVFSSELTASKVILAHRVWAMVDRFVARFGSLKRKRESFGDGWQREYAVLLGQTLVDRHGGALDLVIPPSTIFLTAVVFCNWVEIQGKTAPSLVEHLEAAETTILSEAIMHIIDARATVSESRSWPTLLKSETLFKHVIEHIEKKRAVSQAPVDVPASAALKGAP